MTENPQDQQPDLPVIGDTPPDDATSDATSSTSPIDDIIALRDALQEQLDTLRQYQAVLNDLRAMLKSPAPSAHVMAVGNPASTTRLTADEVREMDVNTVKRRLDEVLGALKRE